MAIPFGRAKYPEPSPVLPNTEINFPAFYYMDDEIVVAASERPVIQTAFNIPVDDVKELEPGHALIVKKDGSVTNSRFAKKQAVKPCSFERIYFSRGTDKDIYKERKKLGAYLAPTILEEINYDFDNTVFSFIPNTASVAFQGLLDEVRDFNANMIQEQIIKSKSNISKKHLQKLFSNKPRVEAIAVKDVKLRTFITADKQRDDLVAHVYDV